MKAVIFSAIGACAMLSGCATTGAPTVPVAAAPVCTSAAQCSAEWAAARTFVVQNAGYRIQTYSRDFMQTYNASGESPDLAAEVNMQPAGNGAYKIAASFWCDNLIGCIPNQWKTLDAFNRAVAAAGQ